MRLSSATIYNQNLNAMLTQESAYQDAAQQVSSGTRWSPFRRFAGRRPSGQRAPGDRGE
jgi:hypothetical protein